MISRVFTIRGTSEHAADEQISNIDIRYCLKQKCRILWLKQFQILGKNNYFNVFYPTFYQNIARPEN